MAGAGGQQICCGAAEYGAVENRLVVIVNFAPIVVGAFCNSQWKPPRAHPSHKTVRGRANCWYLCSRARSCCETLRCRGKAHIEDVFDVLVGHRVLGFRVHGTITNPKGWLTPPGWS